MAVGVAPPAAATSGRHLLVILLALALLQPLAQAFLLSQPRPRTAAPLASSAAANDAPTQATLDSRTPWQLSLVLTREGFDPVRGELRLRFVENRGYEPPQGRIFIERDPLALIATDEKGFAVGPGAAWTLSEDKEDRKWGLWIQGLFEEPNHPYLYFSLVTEDDARVLMETGATDPETGKPARELVPLFGGKGIPGNRLDFRFDHARDRGRVVLSQGQVTFKEVEMRKVDPLGIGGVVNVGDVCEAGAATLSPVLATP